VYGPLLWAVQVQVLIELVIYVERRAGGTAAGADEHETPLGGSRAARKDAAPPPLDFAIDSRPLLPPQGIAPVTIGALIHGATAIPEPG
jgi:hypothetical protein